MTAAVAGTVAKAGPVMAVIVSTTIVSFFALHHAGVSIVGVIPVGLPVPSLPELDLTLTKELLPAAFLISIVGFVETVSVGHTLAAPAWTSRESLRASRAHSVTSSTTNSTATSTSNPRPQNFKTKS